MNNTDYKKETLKEYLEFFGALLIEGPKWCGKTWTVLICYNDY